MRQALCLNEVCHSYVDYEFLKSKISRSEFFLEVSTS